MIFRQFYCRQRSTPAAGLQAVFFGFRRSRAEFSVGNGFNEELNLVDLKDAVAYELKVSKSNRHFEVYHDIFKVIVHNAHQPRWPIQKLIFITSTEGATKLATRSGQAVRALAEQHHSLAVEICGIELEEGMTMPSSAACPREGSFLGRSERPALPVLAMEQFAGRL